MPNTYTQLYIQFVFAVKYRQAMLHPEWEERRRAYMTGIIQHGRHKMIAINNMPDRIHVFVGMTPAPSVSDLMKTVKGGTSGWINQNGFTNPHFAWQEGYGAFSYSRSHIDRVARYMHDQQEHHKKVSFKEEYGNLLDKFGIEYDEQYLFHDPLDL